jgi:hypothetical protein
MAFVRDWFTGELVERPASEPGIIARTSIPKSAVTKRSGSSPWYKDQPCMAMSIKPEEATPERVAQENEAARKHGTGAYYDKDGTCFLPSRGGRAKEMRRRSVQDNDAGFGDWAGR